MVCNSILINLRSWQGFGAAHRTARQQAFFESKRYENQVDDSSLPPPPSAPPPNVAPPSPSMSASNPNIDSSSEGAQGKSIRLILRKV